MRIQPGFNAIAHPAKDPPWACDARAVAQRKADAELVADVFAHVDRLPARMEDLQAIVARAPATPLPGSAICGDRLLIFSQGQGLEFGLMAMQAAAMEGRKPGAAFRQAVLEPPLPYANAAFLVGSALDSEGRYRDAVEALRKAEAQQPGDLGISAELAFALNQSGGASEAVAVVDKAFATHPEAPTRVAALLHRARGFALGDLRRYDEAIAEYRTSQALDPAERVSANEITYLQGRKAGQGASQVRVFTSDKASSPPLAPEARP